MPFRDEPCKNHPGVAALSVCHSCGECFCGACLVEGREYYFCRRDVCQDAMALESTPEAPAGAPRVRGSSRDSVPPAPIERSRPPHDLGVLRRARLAAVASVLLLAAPTLSISYGTPDFWPFVVLHATLVGGPYLIALRRLRRNATESDLRFSLRLATTVLTLLVVAMPLPWLAGLRPGPGVWVPVAWLVALATAQVILAGSARRLLRDAWPESGPLPRLALGLGFLAYFLLVGIPAWLTFLVAALRTLSGAH